MARDDGAIKASRGAARRVIGELKAKKIRVLTQALDEALQMVSAGSSGDQDTRITRLVHLLPRVDSALEGHGGRVANRTERLRGNAATHSPQQRTALSRLSSGQSATLARSGVHTGTRVVNLCAN